MAKTFELKFPFKAGDLEVKAVTIQRPKTKDFIAVGSSPSDSAEADAKLFSSLSGLPASVISQIDVEDWAIIRTQIAYVWLSYFTGTEYKENPTIAVPEKPQEPEPQAKTPEKETPENP